MSLPTRSPLIAALLGALAMLGLGCGKGLFDIAAVLTDGGAGLDTDVSGDASLTGPTDDTAKTSDDATKPPDDTVPPFGDDAVRPADDAGKPPELDGGQVVLGETTKDIGSGGGTIQLGTATLTIGSGTFKDGTTVSVTIRELSSVDHSGAYGPVYEISVPSAKLFLNDPQLTLTTPSVGDNQASLALAMLIPSLSPANQQWVPVYNTKLSDDETTLTGSVTGFGNASVLWLGAVIKCSTSSTCPAHQACNASACQQCPTLTCL